MKVKAVNLVLVAIVLIQVMIYHQSLAVNSCCDLYSMDADLQFVECPGINFRKGGTQVAGKGGGSKKGGSRKC